MVYATDRQTVPSSRDHRSSGAGFWRRVDELIQVVGVSGFFGVAASGFLLRVVEPSSETSIEAEVAAVGIFLGLVIWLVNTRRKRQR